MHVLLRMAGFGILVPAAALSAGLIAISVASLIGSPYSQPAREMGVVLVSGAVPLGLAAALFVGLTAFLRRRAGTARHRWLVAGVAVWATAGIFGILPALVSPLLLTSYGVEDHFRAALAMVGAIAALPVLCGAAAVGAWVIEGRATGHRIATLLLMLPLLSPAVFVVGMLGMRDPVVSAPPGLTGLTTTAYPQPGGASWTLTVSFVPQATVPASAHIELSNISAFLPWNAGGPRTEALVLRGLPPDAAARRGPTYDGRPGNRIARQSIGPSIEVIAGADLPAGAPVSFEISGLLVPSGTIGFDEFRVDTNVFGADGAWLAAGESPVSLVTGDLGLRVALSPDTAGAESQVAVAFTPRAPVPAGGLIRVLLPAGFAAHRPALAAPEGNAPGGLPPGSSLDHDPQEPKAYVLLRGALPAGAPVTFAVTGVTNPPATGSFRVLVRTVDSEYRVIDSSESVVQVR